jgi:hypothetical protein
VAQFRSFTLKFSKLFDLRVSQTASLGWIWSVEGSFMALGAAAGGVVSESFLATFRPWMLPTMIFIGLIILSIGRARLSAANDVPTEEEDLQAMKDISNESAVNAPLHAR